MTSIVNGAASAAAPAGRPAPARPASMNVRTARASVFGIISSYTRYSVCISGCEHSSMDTRRSGDALLGGIAHEGFQRGAAGLDAVRERIGSEHASGFFDESAQPRHGDARRSRVEQPFATPRARPIERFVEAARDPAIGFVYPAPNRDQVHDREKFRCSKTIVSAPPRRNCRTTGRCSVRVPDALLGGRALITASRSPATIISSSERSGYEVSSMDGGSFNTAGSTRPGSLTPA